MKSFGDRRNISFEIGESIEEGLLKIDIWAGDEFLTCFDNHVHVPSFTHSMQREYSFLKACKAKLDAPFFSHGPTTDDVSGRISIDEDSAQISFALRNGHQCSLNIKIQELTQLYERVLHQIDLVQNA